MANMNIKTEKILSPSNIKRIIMLGISIRNQLENTELGLISDYDNTKTYTRGQAVYYNNYLYKCLYTTTGDFDESKWQLIGDNLSLITKDDINAMINLSDEEIASLQSLISTEVRLDKCFSASDTYNRLLTVENNCKTFTMEQLAKKMGASYKVVTTTDEVTSTEFLYLISNSTAYDIYALIEGVVTKIGDTTIDLSQFYTKEQIDSDFLKKTDADGKYITQTSFNSHTSDTDIHTSATEKASYVKKTDITTTIDNTVTDEQIASARAVLKSKSAIRMDESVNPENYEVGAWFAEGHDSIPLSTSYGHPCSEWHIGYVVTGYETSDGTGYKIILAIAMSGNCYIKVQGWNTWTSWRKIYSTSINDIPSTNITEFESPEIVSGKVTYEVKNGICYISGHNLKSGTINRGIILKNLPKTTAIITSPIVNDQNGETVGFAFIDEGDTVLNAHYFKDSFGYFSLSYPVAES